MLQSIVTPLILSIVTLMLVFFLLCALANFATIALGASQMFFAVYVVMLLFSLGLSFTPSPSA